MKPVLAAVLLLSLATVASAQPSQPCCDQPQPPVAEPAPAAPSQDPQVVPAVAYAPPQGPSITNERPAPTDDPDDETGWKRPAGRRFLHGFRLGWTYVMNYDKPTRGGDMSLKSEFDLKSANMMLLGYEGFYRIVGHSWLNVLMVGNVTVAGLEQSKFIPAASGLIGFEFNRSFQLGVGVNVTPDPEMPTHMIAAAGWTPRVGSIMTPIHFFFVPDAETNHRMGATIGMAW